MFKQHFFLSLQVTYKYNRNMFRVPNVNSMWAREAYDVFSTKYLRLFIEQDYLSKRQSYKYELVCIICVLLNYTEEFKHNFCVTVFCRNCCIPINIKIVKIDWLFTKNIRIRHFLFNL